MDWKISRAKGGLKGELTVPPDKSISHRSVMFSSIAKGESLIENFLFAEDCVRTLEAFQMMGVEIKREGKNIRIFGKGHLALTSPKKDLYMGNSATSMRLISGILSGQSFSTRLTGDESLSSRPMQRIIEPLKKMGSDITGRDGKFPPLVINPAKFSLKAIDYKMPIASAQVKSCILAAGLYAEGETIVREPFQSRDHTERMLKYFSLDIKEDGLSTKIKGLGNRELESKNIKVPGDISSAAFFIIAALLVKDSSLILKDVGLNPTRDGILRVLKRMGANIEIFDLRNDFEPIGSLKILSSDLKGTTIEPDEIPLLIDEVPILIIAALLAKGQTLIHGVSELKVKESDRIKSMKDNLFKLGVEIKEENSSLIIEGDRKIFNAAELDSFGDHRIAMSMAIAALFSQGDCVIRNTDCVNTSYPAFLQALTNCTV